MDNREENLGKIKEISNLQKRIQELESDEDWKKAVRLHPSEVELVAYKEP